MDDHWTATGANPQMRWCVNGTTSAHTSMFEFWCNKSILCNCRNSENMRKRKITTYCVLLNSVGALSCMLLFVNSFLLCFFPSLFEYYWNDSYTWCVVGLCIVYRYCIRIVCTYTTIKAQRMDTSIRNIPSYSYTLRCTYNIRKKFIHITNKIRSKVHKKYTNEVKSGRVNEREEKEKKKKKRNGKKRNVSVREKDKRKFAT